MSDAPVALITLAGEYVGPALARTLARSGHRLALHAPGGEVVSELVASGTEVVAIPGSDVTATAVGGLDTAAVNEAIVGAVLERFGRLDAACLVTGRIVVGRFLDAAV